MEKETQIGLGEFHLAKWLTDSMGLNLFETAIVLQQLEWGHGLGTAIIYMYDLKYVSMIL